MDRGHQMIRQWKLLRLLESRRGGITVAEAHALLDETCVELLRQCQSPGALSAHLVE